MNIENKNVVPVMANASEHEDEIDLLDVCKHLLNYWFPILACTLVCMILMGVYTKFFITPMYSARSMVYFRDTSSSVTVSEIQVSNYLSEDYSLIFKSRPIMEKTIKDLSLDISPSDLSGKISISKDNNTRILKISTTWSDPEVARDIINRVTDYGVETTKIIEDKEPYIVERAYANYDKVSPSLLKNVAIAGMGGLAVSCGLLVVAYLLNDKIKSVSQIEEKLGIPVLGTLSYTDTLHFDKTGSDKKRKKHSHSKKSNEGAE